jgi:tRNA(Leu) C34 or U34 (ribose-2'-O)-methylase TrmL
MSHHDDRQTTDNCYSMLGLINPKNCFNVGAVLRAAGCFDSKMVVATNDRFTKKGDWRHMDTEKIHKKIPFIYGADTIKNFIPHDCIPVAIELCKTAVPLPEYKHPDRAFYIFGPEDGSVDDETLSLCRDKVYIPMEFCSNLSATSYIVLYDRMMKSYGKIEKALKCPNCNGTHYVVDKDCPTDNICQACGKKSAANLW